MCAATVDSTRQSGGSGRQGDWRQRANEVMKAVAANHGCAADRIPPQPGHARTNGVFRQTVPPEPEYYCVGPVPLAPAHPPPYVPPPRRQERNGGMPMQMRPTPGAMSSNAHNAMLPRRAPPPPGPPPASRKLGHAITCRFLQKIDAEAAKLNERGPCS